MVFIPKMIFTLSCLIPCWISSVDGGYFYDMNYYTETPSLPTVFTMMGPTHVLVHINPDIHKFYADKVIDYYDKQNLSDFTAFCRCWRSRRFPYCDGFHKSHNELVGDNVGPLIVRKRNVTNAAVFYRRIKKLNINASEIGDPPLCTKTPFPKTTTKRRHLVTDPEVDLDFMFNQYGHVLYNFTKYLEDFVKGPYSITPYKPPPPDTRPRTTPTPTLWFPTYKGCDIVYEKPSEEEEPSNDTTGIKYNSWELKHIKKRKRRRRRHLKQMMDFDKKLRLIKER